LLSIHMYNLLCALTKVNTLLRTKSYYRIAFETLYFGIIKYNIINKITAGDKWNVLQRSRAWKMLFLAVISRIFFYLDDDDGIFGIRTRCVCNSMSMCFVSIACRTRNIEKSSAWRPSPRHLITTIRWVFLVR